MTPYEIELAHALHACTYPPGSPPKRFAREMAFLATHSPEREITLRQRHYMEINAWRYRRQMPAHLVPESKPLDLPPKRPKPKRVRSLAQDGEKSGTPGAVQGRLL